MGIHWKAVDIVKKKQIEPFEPFDTKIPGLYNPNSPFPNIIMMMNTRGYNFQMCHDAYEQGPYFGDYEDITEEVLKEFIKQFPPEVS
jgi:hypothetical protein